MALTAHLTEMLLSTAQHVPLEWFSFLGSFIEEVVAPIPSPFVMTAAGSAVAAQGKMWWYILLVSLIGAVGKTLGALVVYILGDKAEDILIGKLGKFVGVTHKEVEMLGKHFQGGWRDDVILLVLRAIPIMPSAPISVMCGVIKLNLRTYITSTFIGTFFRNLLYVYLGYVSLSAVNSISQGLQTLESLTQIVLFVLAAVAVLWIYWQRQKQQDASFLQKLSKIFRS